jgi:hypothetical protein
LATLARTQTWSVAARAGVEHQQCSARLLRDVLGSSEERAAGTESARPTMCFGPSITPCSIDKIDQLPTDLVASQYALVSEFAAHLANVERDKWLNRRHFRRPRIPSFVYLSRALLEPQGSENKKVDPGP